MLGGLIQHPINNSSSSLEEPSPHDRFALFFLLLWYVLCYFAKAKLKTWPKLACSSFDALFFFWWLGRCMSVYVKLNITAFIFLNLIVCITHVSEMNNLLLVWVLWEAEGVRWRHRGLHQHYAGRQTKPSPSNGCHVDDGYTRGECICGRSWDFRHEHQNRSF